MTASEPVPFAPPPGFVDMTEADGITVDLRYAGTNNILGRNIYGSYDRLLLHEIAAAKLAAAASLLAERRPGLKLLVFDGLRPNRVQRMFWALVRGTDQERYVADPEIGSVHGFGLAVDLSLADAAGAELDMGTPFDDLTPLAEPRLEPHHLASGALTQAQVENRLVLRGVMEQAGFITLPIEWWHFDAVPAEEARARFRLVE